MEQILVGYDGSKSAHEAVVWAADEAQRRGFGVHVVQSWKEPIFTDRPLLDLWADPEAAVQRTREDLHEVARTFAASHPTVPFTEDLVGGQPDRVLVEAAADASMVVVGARGQGGFARLLLGSVSRRVAGAAPCTVVVVREPVRGGDVVVGVDGTAPSRRALEWAAVEAEARSCPLRVVMAWSYLSPYGEDGPEPFRPSYTGEDAEQALQAIVRDVLGDDALAEAVLESPCDLAGKALIERGEHAALLVIGGRDPARSRFDLGSVHSHVLDHATCPVALVRP